MRAVGARVAKPHTRLVAKVAGVVERCVSRIVGGVDDHALLVEPLRQLQVAEATRDEKGLSPVRVDAVEPRARRVELLDGRDLTFSAGAVDGNPAALVRRVELFRVLGAEEVHLVHGSLRAGQ